MTTMYRLKISLVQPHYPITKLHRVLEILGNASFFDLHQRIFEAFDRFDEHAFQFFISRTKMDSFASLFDNCTEIVIIDKFMGNIKISWGMKCSYILPVKPCFMN